jgi:PAS domain S-box-containing protein
MSGFDANLNEYCREVMWADEERVFCRFASEAAPGDRYAYLPVGSDSGHALRQCGLRLAHEYALKDYLDATWALKPIELGCIDGQAALFVEFPGGVRLDRLIRQPLDTGCFLCLAAAMAFALGQLHGRGLVHKNIKPSNVIVDPETGRAWLSGFGIASRLSRQRQSPEFPAFMAGTPAYMAPEQTGHMNRSTDSRSDLYSLGVTFYEMLTASLPFHAPDPMAWVHCHIAQQPAPPVERQPGIPPTISAIVMKLLSKTAEERYQTAQGLEFDLRRCLAEWHAEGRVHSFAPGARDTPDRLVIPEKLYGRERETGLLLAAFERIVAGGRPELLLVSGCSGVGKSTLVNELHKPLMPLRGFFASGKFDQFKRDTPYATLAQAFRSLVLPLLGRSEEDLGHWRDAFRTALGSNARLMIDLVPELKYIIGEPPAVRELPPREAQRHFQLAVRRFIAVFARPEHPLVLFVDDVQWLDTETLDLLEDVLRSTDLQYLLLIGAYRNKEVDAAHPLARKLVALHQARAPVHEIVLAPLDRDDLRQMLMDALACESARAAPLAALVHKKTGGNPFFAIQFMSKLADEKLLAFDHATARWDWDLQHIDATHFTDNILALMVDKLHGFRPETQDALQQLAYLGNTAAFDMLDTVYQGGTVDDLHAHLWDAVSSGLIFRARDSYCFLHDRVQEAAYMLIPEQSRAKEHLRIGLLLAARMPAARCEEAIFDIVNQLNRGACHIASTAERELVAGLNLRAGRRARNATAFEAARKFLTSASALLEEETWRRHHDLAFAIELLCAECELMMMEMTDADERLARLAPRARNRHEVCLVTRLTLTLYTALDRSDCAVAVFLAWLRGQGTAWPDRPTREDALREYESVWTSLGTRTIEALVDLPMADDRDVIDTMDVFTEIVTSALFYDEHLFSLVVCRMVNLSLAHGNCDASCFGYTWFAMAAGSQFGNYRGGYRFGQLGFDLVEQRGLTRYQARTYITFGSAVVPWIRDATSERELIRRAFDLAYRAGDLTFAAYRGEQLVANYLLAGDALPEVEVEAENGLAFGKWLGFAYVTHLCGAQLGLVRSLRGPEAGFGRLNHDGFDESVVERQLAGNSILSLAEFNYWTRKMQARFFAGDFTAAVDAAQRAQRLLWAAPSQIVTADYRFYAALTHALAWDSSSAEGKVLHAAALEAHQKQLAAWAQHCPANFADRNALVLAEIARIENRILDAQMRYDEAVRLAHGKGAVHNEAVASELAGRFYTFHGYEKIAKAYLVDARCRYRDWGADAKVRQLERLYPWLGARDSIPSPASTMHAPVERLDLATVLRISDAISGEIVLEKLVDTLMRTAIESAGAERGLLILPCAEAYRIEAAAITGDKHVHVDSPRTDLSAADLPESVFRHALRTRQSVLLHDACGRSAFSSDSYIRQHRARSVLCLPLLKEKRMLGMLYLENRLASHAFTPARMAVLKLLACEAAISLENARLYRDLAEREARIRRLVDANIIGIVISDDEGRILDANDAFVHIVGHEREDLVARGMRWTDLTPPEWLYRDHEFLGPELKSSGRLQPFEKEFLRKDGSRVPVLMGVANFEDGKGECVAFVLDLTERRSAADALRTLQMDLAHANRLVTMGQLTASIAHEINQPIGAMRNNAHAALRFLAANPPRLGEATEALESVVNDTYRARDIIGGIRDQVSNIPPRKENVDLNDAIRDVALLVRGELSKHGVVLHTRLCEQLLPVRADRVQLQQVVLNLVINAIEAMAGAGVEKRLLSITTEASASEGVIVTVCDTGPGIAPEHREQVFESFYTTKDGGVGIGLSICRSIIDAHGGKLWADTHLPHGGLLRFTLPT